ncbi:MAG: hypothetical protein NC392_06110 [Roseburia sp.]|nr:hypothetical protein [Roseburia sp.]MCM1201675.1 hypothetical protein [Bacteroides fragilis]
MRKSQKKEILGILNSLEEAHDEIREGLTQGNSALVQNLLTECQTTAISLGELIENMEGKGHITVSFFEEYCELLFRLYEDSGSHEDINRNKIYKILRKQLIKIENSVKNDIVVRKEIVFFPYKASMWDSLESIYLAAKEDPDCDAYCVPIPYFKVNSDRTLGQMQYEGYDYPSNIEITDWEKYDFENRKPDVIYIHNPYDNWNLVTSVHPRFYSANLRKYTDCLVYVPYYSTTGGMNEGQRALPVYFIADYIVTQAPMFRSYFDEDLPDQKFLPFGSPKFDKIINKCKNPPEPPAAWKKKMEGRKVYFYNTSINGMLGNTEAFLKKLQYVFDTFQGRDDACILWRPHPLLESTFDSMRPEYRAEYERLRKYYMENDIGIFDNTPDMTDAISWSDAYIGDAGTSVTSVFGIVGKPMFIMSNQYHSLPKEDSWRGPMVGTGFNYYGKDRFAILGNQLYVSEPYRYDYKYFCDLSEYAGGAYYAAVFEINGKRFACPRNAQDILVMNDRGIERKIELEKRNGSNDGSFYGAWPYGKYLILLPFKYPALVIYDTETDKTRYFEDAVGICVRDNERNEKVAGASWIFEGTLYMASPVDNLMYALDIESGGSEVIGLPTRHKGGYSSMVENDGSIWMLPYRGQTITNWNPKTGAVREYTGFPKGFECFHPAHKMPTDEYPLAGWAFIGKTIYFTRNWGNMDIKLDTETGVFSEWDVPIPNKENMEAVAKEYFSTTGKYVFVRSIEEKDRYRLFYYPERKLYDFDIEKNELNEIEIKFDVDELKRHEPGFHICSQWMKYCCCESVFNSLKDLLDGNISGGQFDRERQIESYGEIAANNDGSCGQKVHEFIKSRT